MFSTRILYDELVKSPEDRRALEKWELRHEVGATVDPRAEFAAVDFGIDFIRCAALRDKG